MSKFRSITQQLIHALCESAAIGESKRGYKGQHDGSTDYKVFSIAYMNDLRTTAQDLGAYIRATDPTCRRVRDIYPAVLQKFLQDKATAGLSRESLSKLQSHICKLERCTSHTYGCTAWHTEQLRLPSVQPDKQPSKIRDYVASDKDVIRLIEAMRQPRCGESWKAVVLSRYAGLRVSEAAMVRAGRINERGGRWGCGTITLQGKEDGCKGGRWRTVDILTPEAADWLRKAVEGRRAGEFIIQQVQNDSPVKADSLRRALKRAVARDPEVVAHWKSNNGYHAFRKAFAQQSYDVARRSGCDKKDAADYANKQLGHGRDRTELTAAYIHNQW